MNDERGDTEDGVRVVKLFLPRRDMDSLPAPTVATDVRMLDDGIPPSGVTAPMG